MVIAAVTVLSIVSVTLMRDYQLGQVDQQLRNPARQQAAVKAVNDFLSGYPSGAQAEAALAEAGYAVFWIPVGGSPQEIAQPAKSTPGAVSANQVLPGQSLSAVEGQLTANRGVTATVPGRASGDRWRVIGVSVSGKPGTLIIGEDVSSVYSTIGQLTEVNLIVSTAIVLVLLIAGFTVVRANLRPLNDIELTAGQIAAGHLDQRVPERGTREFHSLSRSLNTMLSQIETAFRAQQESEDAAHRKEERMRRFIADAGYELRTPLTTLRGFAEYYRQRGGVRDEDTGMTPAELDQIMRRLESEASRMSLLVEDLLQLARLDQQRPLEMSLVDLLTLAADAVQDARMVDPERQVELTVAPGAAFLVMGDEARLRQVIGNLVTNARVHTPPEASIRVAIASGTLATGAPAAVLDVIDNGPGMTSEQAQRAFERFYRADAARNRASGGTGLGLAIVAGLVEAHGGEVSVTTAPGQGADFTVRLPLSPDALRDLEEPPDQADAPGPNESSPGTR
jgi:two-component system OmpR family sensor kinase